MIPASFLGCFASVPYISSIEPKNSLQCRHPFGFAFATCLGNRQVPLCHKKERGDETWWNSNRSALRLSSHQPLLWQQQAALIMGCAAGAFEPRCQNPACSYAPPAADGAKGPMSSYCCGELRIHECWQSVNVKDCESVHELWKSNKKHINTHRLWGQTCQKLHDQSLLWDVMPLGHRVLVIFSGTMMLLWPFKGLCWLCALHVSFHERTSVPLCQIEGRQTCQSPNCWRPTFQSLLGFLPSLRQSKEGLGCFLFSQQERSTSARVEQKTKLIAIAGAKCVHLRRQNLWFPYKNLDASPFLRTDINTKSASEDIKGCLAGKIAPADHERSWKAIMTSLKETA